MRLEKRSISTEPHIVSVIGHMNKINAKKITQTFKGNDVLLSNNLQKYQKKREKFMRQSILHAFKKRNVASHMNVIFSQSSVANPPRQ